MLFDLIRDFFVEHVFGGMTSIGNIFTASLGMAINEDGYIYTEQTSTNDVFFKNGSYGTYEYVSIGDYFSTLATLISITFIVVLCCLFVYKIIKLIGGLFR